MHDLLDLKEDFNRTGILITFNGPFNHSIIEEIGNATKSYLEGAQLGAGIISDVFAVYIEQTQNVRNYIADRGLADRGRDGGIVVIRRSEGFYAISSGNGILKSDVPELSRRLDEVRVLDKDGLKRRYKEELRKDRGPDARGAGVGIIDMARRASAPLGYRFQPLDEEFDFFTLTVTVAGV